MAVSTSRADPYSLYSDLLDNNFFGNLFGLMYQALSGDDLSGTTITAGIFVGDLKCFRLAGMSILAWGSVAIFFFKKNKLVSGLLTSWSVFFVNIILIIRFWGFNTGDSEFFYTSTECSFGWGYRLLILGVAMMLIGAIKTYELVKLDFPKMFVLNKATKFLICGWVIVLLDYVLKVPVPDIITFTIFNVTSLYCFVPHIRAKGDTHGIS